MSKSLAAYLAMVAAFAISRPALAQDSAAPKNLRQEVGSLSRAEIVPVEYRFSRAASDPMPNRRLVDDIGLDQHLNEQVPLDLEFTDEHGQRVRLGEYFHDKPVILTCVYFRCPMLCTQVLNGVLKSTNAMSLQMGKDYTVVSISIDPRETTEMAAAKKETYVQSYRRAGAEEGWHFLTGDQQSIAALTKAVGFRYKYDEPSDQFMHASGIMVLTPEGKLSRYYYGIDYPPRDLRLGLVESSERRIGGPVDQVLLLCFHYDPQTGRYGLVISRVIRIAGIGTLAAMGIFLSRMYFLERRRSAAVAAAKGTV
jgi:protein SCO1/2